MGNPNPDKNGKEPDLNQILKNKREKLANLQAAGRDPFVITKYDQTDHTADAKAAFEELEKKGDIENAEPCHHGCVADQCKHCRTYHAQTCYGQGFVHER